MYIDIYIFVEYNRYRINPILGSGILPFLIEYYEKNDGTFPAEEFILSQDNKMKAKIFRNLELLEQRGNELREPYSKHIGDGIFELRSKVSSDISRVMYFFVIGEKIILTNGFIKKSQKTPKSEIELAKKYRNDYLNRED